VNKAESYHLAGCLSCVQRRTHQPDPVAYATRLACGEPCPV